MRNRRDRSRSREKYQRESRRHVDHRAHERRPLHIKLNEKEWTTIEIENLTRNVSEAHL